MRFYFIVSLPLLKPPPTQCCAVKTYVRDANLEREVNKENETRGWRVYKHMDRERQGGRDSKKRSLERSFHRNEVFLPLAKALQRKGINFFRAR